MIKHKIEPAVKIRKCGHCARLIKPGEFHLKLLATFGRSVLNVCDKCIIDIGQEILRHNFNLKGGDNRG